MLFWCLTPNFASGENSSVWTLKNWDYFLFFHFLTLASSAQASDSLIKISISIIFCMLCFLLKHLSSSCLVTDFSKYLAFLCSHCSSFIVMEFSSNRSPNGPFSSAFPSSLPQLLLLICHFSVNTEQRCRNACGVHLVSPDCLSQPRSLFIFFLYFHAKTYLHRKNRRRCTQPAPRWPR